MSLQSRAQERSRGVFSFDGPLGGAALEEPYPGGYMTCLLYTSDAADE